MHTLSAISPILFILCGTTKIAEGFSSAPTSLAHRHNSFARNLQIVGSTANADDLSSSSDESKVFEPAPTTSSYAWDKLPAKKSLSRPDVQQSHTAMPWLLNVIEFGHYSVVIPQLVTVYSLVDNFEFWSAYLDGNSLQLTLWFLAPIIRGILSVIPTFLMHAYEDWQISPTTENAKVEEENNDRLQQLALNQMFLFLCVGDLLYYHGYFGLNQFLPVSVAVVAYGCLGDKNHLVNQLVPSMNPKLSFGSALGQIVGPVMKGIVSFQLASEVGGHHPLVQAALLSSAAFEIAGGVYEGTVAETTFSQWDHLKAVSMINIGSALQAFAFLSLPHLLQ